MKKIAVIRFGKLGDTILTTPVFENLKLNFKFSKVDAFILPFTYQILKNNPYIDRIILVRKKRLKSLKNIVQFAGYLKRQKYEMAIILQNSLSSALICYLAKIKIRAGYAVQGRSFFLTHPVKENNRYELNEVERNLNILRAIGIPIRTRTTNLFFNKYEEKIAERFMNDMGLISKQNFFCVAPFASTSVRLWPIERYIELMSWVYNSYRLIPVIIAAEEESEKVRVILKKIKYAIDTSKLELFIKMFLIKHSRLLICPNTGPMHMGAALRCPTVAIFGPQSEVCWGYKWEKFKIVKTDISCRPCNRHKCRFSQVKCMDNISVEEVFRFVKCLLND